MWEDFQKTRDKGAEKKVRFEKTEVVKIFNRKRTRSDSDWGRTWSIQLRFSLIMTSFLRQLFTILQLY
jgi:hypothetical protein